MLYIQRSCIKDDDTDQTESAEDVTYYITNDVFYTPKIMSIVFVKRGLVLEADKPIRSQVSYFIINIFNLIQFYLILSRVELLHKLNRNRSDKFLI